MSDMNANAAADAINKMWNAYGRPLEHAKEVAAFLANADQAVKEKKAAIEALNKETDKAKGDLEKAKAELSKADGRAAEIIANAQERADRIVADAKEKADKVSADSAALQDKARQQLVELNAQIAAAKKEQKDVQDAIAQGKAEIDGIQSHAARLLQGLPKGAK